LHVVAFVHEKAISAGAMIALAANEIVMEPRAMLGDSAPISLAPGGGGMQPMGAAERAKAESPILEDFRSSAARNGYDPLLAEAMVSVGRAVHWVENDQGQRRFVDDEEFKKLTAADGKWRVVADLPDPIDSGDTLLTVSTDRALKLGLAKGTAASVDDLAAQRGYKIMARFEPTGGDQFVSWLSSGMIRFILLDGLPPERVHRAAHAPGTGAAEAIAVISLGLLLGVPLLTGYAAWWEVAVIFLGADPAGGGNLRDPGHGVMGIVGAGLMLFGLIMTFVGDEPPKHARHPAEPPRHVGGAGAGLIVVVGGLVASMFLWFWLNRYLPKLPYFNRLILDDDERPDDDGSGNSGVAASAAHVAAGRHDRPRGERPASRWLCRISRRDDSTTPALPTWSAKAASSPPRRKCRARSPRELCGREGGLN
jgi:membrane-bound serine protease (ClpP class)